VCLSLLHRICYKRSPSRRVYVVFWPSDCRAPIFSYVSWSGTCRSQSDYHEEETTVVSGGDASISSLVQGLVEKRIEKILCALLGLISTKRSNYISTRYKGAAEIGEITGYI